MIKIRILIIVEIAKKIVDKLLFYIFAIEILGQRILRGIRPLQK